MILSRRISAAACFQIFAFPAITILKAWLEPFFAVYRFLQVSDAFDDTYRLIIDPGTQSVTLFCVDPSKRLAQTLKGLRSAIFFSATLSPLDYFIDVLGGSPESARGS